MHIGVDYGADTVDGRKNSPAQKFFSHNQGVILSVWHHLSTQQSPTFPRAFGRFWGCFGGSFNKIRGGKLFNFQSSLGGIFFFRVRYEELRKILGHTGKNLEIQGKIRKIWKYWFLGGFRWFRGLGEGFQSWWVSALVNPSTLKLFISWRSASNVIEFPDWE